MGRKSKVEGLFTLKIDGHQLSGEKRSGRWKLSCPSWPDLVDQYDGCADASDALDEFTSRATGLKEKLSDGIANDGDDGS